MVNSKTQVVIADANSTDNTLNIVQSFNQHMQVKVVKGGLPPVDRNNGARWCNTRYIMFMDADVKHGSADTLENIVNVAESRALDMGVPKIKIYDAGWRDKIFEYLYFFTAKTKIPGAFGTGMFVCIKNETFKQLWPFNENLPLGDDWELTHKINPGRFTVGDTSVYTSNRRFKSSGYFSTFYMWASVALNKTTGTKGIRNTFPVIMWDNRIITYILLSNAVYGLSKLTLNPISAPIKFWYWCQLVLALSCMLNR